MSFFAVSAPGLEKLTGDELVGMDLAAHVEPGGVNFQGDLTVLYRANLYLRSASRVLVRLGEFQAVNFQELRKKAGRLPWATFLRPGQAIVLRVTCHKSRLYHSGAVTERIASAIGDALGQPPVLEKTDEEAPGPAAQLIVVRLLQDVCTVSVDSSGEHLHRRGYRLASAKAPLRETLAAGMLLASGWDCTSPLLDPFCGSGTIPIEAALLALGAAPGRKRAFAFLDWPGFNQPAWEKLLQEHDAALSARIAAGNLPAIHAADRDAGAVQLAQANAARAGVLECIRFACQAVSYTAPEGVGWVVTNPPYGLRLRSAQDLRNLFAQFGRVLRTKCVGWHVAILCPDPILLGHTGLKLDARHTLVNGGVAVRLGLGVVPG